MKRAALFHTKMDLLMERLGCPRFVAVGILESLWCLTAREAPRGDIGRLSNERIAKGIDWRGHKNASLEQEGARLVQALADSGWIDASTEHRFVIHDWNEHCDNSVKRYLKRNGLSFRCPGHVKPCPDKTCLPEASSQKPEASSQKPVQTADRASPAQNQNREPLPISGDPGRNYTPSAETVQRAMKDYGEHGEVNPEWDCRVFLSVIQTPADEETYFRNTADHFTSRKFREGFAPSWSNYLTKRQWKHPPRPDIQRKSKFAQILEEA